VSHYFFVKNVATNILTKTTKFKMQQNIKKILQGDSQQSVRKKSAKKPYKNWCSPLTGSVGSVGSGSFIMTMVLHPWSTIIAQKSLTVNGSGACVIIYASLCLYAYWWERETGKKTAGRHDKQTVTETVR